MNLSVDMSCEMKVNRNCELCRLKVSEIMHCLTALYSVDFVGETNTIKLKARANPNLILATIQKYGDHGKLSNFHMDGEPITPLPGGGFNAPSGYYLPSNAAGNFPYPSPYPPPQFPAGNYGYPMPNPPPRQTEAPREETTNQHTAPPSFTLQPPPPRPLSSYSYIEPPYWPTSSSSGGKCVIM